MIKIRIVISLTLVLLLCEVSAQGLRVKGTRIVNEKGDEVILRGMGLGGWMLQEGYMLRVRGIGQQQHVIKNNLAVLMGLNRTNEFYDAWLANHTREIDIDSMAAWGFNSVRLAMHYNLYTLPVEQEPVAGQQTWIEKGFTITDELLRWCKKNKMYLILDLHAAPGGQGNDNNISDRDPGKPNLWESEANRKKMIALWRKLAERYANEPWLGAYDIINEPNWGFENANDKNGCGEQKNEPLRALMVDVTRAIREVDKNHIVIVEGNCWGNNYNGIFPLWDDNTVVSFHKYWNYNDPGSIQKFIDIRQKYQVPVWLGESGENSNLWFRDAINLMESNSIGWAWWPLKKLGFNNPLEVKVPPGYQKILDYWAGTGPLPSPDDAYTAVMQLAENLKLENCIYHPDVVDAMFRQVKTDAVVPIKKHTASPGTIINAADYDLGRNRFAYFDKDTANYYISTGGPRTAGNRGHTYRNDGVDIESGNHGTFISKMETGEWVQYTITARKKGIVNISISTAAEADGGKLRVTINGKAAAPVPVPKTEKDSWNKVTVRGLQLNKGTNQIRIVADSGDFSVATLEFVK